MEEFCSLMTQCSEDVRQKPLSSYLGVGVVPGVDLPEQSVSSALSPVIMVSNERSSNKISLLLRCEGGPGRQSVRGEGGDRHQLGARSSLLRKHTDWWGDIVTVN